MACATLGFSDNTIFVPSIDAPSFYILSKATRLIQTALLIFV